jgi:hypothetical protein
MSRRIMALTLPAAILFAAGAGAETSATELIQQVIRAAGGTESFRAIGVLQINADEQETLTEGTTNTSSFVAYVDTSNLSNMRMEFGKDVVLACQNGRGWATVGGTLDSRPLAPRMAAGTLRQRLFPLLLPFSLQMEGIRPGEVTGDELGDEPVWLLKLDFTDDFFASPIMTSTWELIVRRSDHAILAAQFQPPREFRQAQTEGVRYRALSHTELAGTELPEKLVVSGLEANGFENSHVRIVGLEWSSRGPSEPALFVHPETLKKLEENVPGFEDEPQ